jgi:hypothetical protein
MNNGIMPLRLTDTAKTSMDSLTKNEVADMNSSYLKQKPGTYLKDPILTPYTKEAALAELRSSAGELPNLAEPTIAEDSSLKNKLKYLISNDINNKPTYKALLGELQEIEKYVARFPITDALNDRLGAIQAQIDATLFSPAEPVVAAAEPVVAAAEPVVAAAEPVVAAAEPVVAAAEPEEPPRTPIKKKSEQKQSTPGTPRMFAADFSNAQKINKQVKSQKSTKWLKMEIWNYIGSELGLRKEGSRADRVKAIFKDNSDNTLIVQFTVMGIRDGTINYDTKLDNFIALFKAMKKNN